MQKLVTCGLAVIFTVVTLGGCASTTRTEQKSEENTQTQEQKHENTEDTFAIDLTVQGLPLVGTITRTSRTVGDKVSDQVKTGTANSFSKTQIEMPPEMKLLMGQMSSLLKIAGNLGLPGGGIGGGLMSKLGDMIASPEGLMTAGGGAAGASTLMMQWQRRRLKEQLDQKEKEVSDDYEKDVKQIVQALDAFFADVSITQDCKDLLKTYLSKYMDTSAKNLVRELRGT